MCRWPERPVLDAAPRKGDVTRLCRPVDSAQGTRASNRCHPCCINLLIRTFIDSIKHASMMPPSCLPRARLLHRLQGLNSFSTPVLLRQPASRTPSSRGLGRSLRKMSSLPTARKSSHGSLLSRYPVWRADYPEHGKKSHWMSHCSASRLSFSAHPHCHRLKLATMVPGYSSLSTAK